MYLSSYIDSSVTAFADSSFPRQHNRVDVALVPSPDGSFDYFHSSAQLAGLSLSADIPC